MNTQIREIVGVGMMKFGLITSGERRVTIGERQEGCLLFALTLSGGSPPPFAARARPDRPARHLARFHISMVLPLRC